MTAPRLEIAIDELLVRGLSPGDARAAAAALEERLATLAAGPTEELRPRAEASRRLPSLEVRGSSPRAVGDAVAGAVWSELGGMTRDGTP